MTPLLAQRLRADRAFERMYRRHVTDVYRYTLAVLNNPADAEDVTQTTFLNAYRAMQRGERPRAPHHWLIKIAHNVCRQRFRQTSRRPEEVFFDENVAESIVPDDDGPSADDLRRAISHLAFNQRAALVMRELEGRSYAEIADVLGVSVSAVETLIFRARRALREQLEGGLTCSEAERAISKQLDGALSRGEKGVLRAHLRECNECATLARKQRAQRVALRGFGLVPLPQTLAAMLGGGGGAAVGAGVATKAAAVAATAIVATGVGYEATKRTSMLRDEPARQRAAAVAPERTRATPAPERTRAALAPDRANAALAPALAGRPGGVVAEPTPDRAGKIHAPRKNDAKVSGRLAKSARGERARGDGRAAAVAGHARKRAVAASGREKPEAKRARVAAQRAKSAAAKAARNARRAAARPQRTVERAKPDRARPAAGARRRAPARKPAPAAARDVEPPQRPRTNKRDLGGTSPRARESAEQQLLPSLPAEPLQKQKH